MTIARMSTFLSTGVLWQCALASYPVNQIVE
jgi:hypothetical protein